MKAKLTLVTLLITLFSFGAFAQSGTITGSVTDSSGEPLIGASILLKGTTQGTITDIDGNFTMPGITFPVEVTVSFIGLKDRDLTINDESECPLVIVLTADENELSEVVVVGYGTQKRVNLTGAVGVIDGKDLEQRPVTSAAQALQGADPSLILTNGSGSVEGNNFSMSIRGSVSLNSGDPLVLIDGIEGNTDLDIMFTNP